MKKIQKNYRFLIKFGEREHMEALQRGDIYMNTLAYFRTQPEEDLIGDILEGITSFYSFKNAPFTVNKIKMIGDLNMHPTDRYQGNIFCMYGGDEDLLEQNLVGTKGTLPIGETFKSPYFAIINNPKVFYHKIEAYSQLAGYSVKAGQVNYLNYEKHQQKLTPFCKRERYKDQNEFRIFIANDLDKTLEFNIGDISDICHIGAVTEHNNLEYAIF